MGERLHDEGRERGQLVSAKPGAFARTDRAGGATSKTAIIDIGGGASRLVDHLVEQGFEDVTVLDLSGAALAAAKSRLESHLGANANRVGWIVADATTWEPARPYDIWHDRAAFHFLTDASDRAAYIARLGAA